PAEPRGAMLALFGRRRISDSILWIAPVQSLVRIASKRSAAGFQKYVFQPTTKRSPTTPTLPPTADSKRPLDGFGTHIGPGQMLRSSPKPYGRVTPLIRVISYPETPERKTTRMT